LLVSGLTAAACALWVILHRFDMRLETPVLTRRKFVALAFVAPLALGDLALAGRFARELDFSVVASCCSVWLDDNVLRQKTALVVMDPGPAAAVGLLAVLAGAATSGWAAWRPGRWRAFLAAAVSAAAPAGALLGILWVVAPHALATPQHPCPFCLFHVQGGWVGWPLFSAMFVASVSGLGLGVVEIQQRRPADAAALRSMERTLGRWSALGWAGVLLCGVYPVARYWLGSGGVSVFGEL
jgi:hypothetical protein